MTNRKIIFAVQGEGRGHLTQAMAAYEILTREGFTVCSVIVGISDNRLIPEFFTKAFNIPIIKVESPNFSMDKKTKSVNIGKSFLDNLYKFNKYRKSLKSLDAVLKEHEPDLVINFYEPLIACYAMLKKCPFKIIAIAHQYIYLHPHFRFPEGNSIKATALRFYTWLTARGSSARLVISMYDIPPVKDAKLRVCPPLLRKQIYSLQKTEEDFILVYLLNSGYTQDIVKYHKRNPEIKLACFTDSKEVRDQYHGELRLDDNLVFYGLNDAKFLHLMSKCKALVCTAGFESVCEAMYLDKPVMMVPVKGHYEQFCNALDASRIGAGIYSSEFDLSKMQDCLLFYDKKKNERYREWANEFESIFIMNIQLVC